MNKFNIRKNREKLSDQEIQQNMNFDKFISGYTPGKSWFPKGGKFYSIFASTVAVLTVAGYLIYKNQMSENVTSEKPFINPPSEILNVPADLFVCLSAEDTTIVHSTGTIIHVPASAFADEKGNDISGAVQIKYREFHDQADIMVSGIPMNYDSAGAGYLLESAGMFELKAFQGNKPVQLKPGKSIMVNMVSHTNNSSDYNLYYLDTVTRKWNYIAENTKTNNTCLPVFEVNEPYAQKMKAEDAKMEQARPVFPAKADPGEYNFVIDFKKDEFPELAAFTGLKFQPVEKKKKLHTQLSKQVWENISIERNVDPQFYDVTFSSEKQKQTIKVKPVVDDKDYNKQKAEYDKKLKLYETFLAAKKRREKEKKDSLYRISKIYEAVAQNSDLNERLNNFIDGNFMETSRDLLVYRTFSINKLGIWNSDKPFKFFASDEKYSARFVSERNVDLVLKCVYFMKRDVNSIYRIEDHTYSKMPFAKNIDVIVGIGYDNSLYYLKDDEIKLVDTGDKVLELKMKEAKGVMNTKDLKQLFKI